MLGTAICFFIAQYLGRPVVAKLVSEPALASADCFFERYGKHAVFIARLIPLVSFDVISYGAGLTGMRFLGFWIVTGIGQLPATILYSYLGAQMTGTIQILFWAFGIVVAISIVRALIKRRTKAILVLLVGLSVLSVSCNREVTHNFVASAQELLAKKPGNRSMSIEQQMPYGCLGRSKRPRLTPLSEETLNITRSFGKVGERSKTPFF